MGHITVTADNVADLRARVAQLNCGVSLPEGAAPSKVGKVLGCKKVQFGVMGALVGAAAAYLLVCPKGKK
jgi:hypothetical protein